MRRTVNISVGFIDIVGGVLVAACVGVAGWTILVASEETSANTSEYRRLLASATRDADELRTARADQHVVLAEALLKLDTRGKLPPHAPVEQYFQALSQLAESHHASVVRHSPLSVRTYPGLREQRFAYEVTGTTGNLLRFLRAIEETDFWADVSHLKIDGESLMRNGGGRNPTAALTISLFSGPNDESVGVGSEGA